MCCLPELLKLIYTPYFELKIFTVINLKYFIINFVNKFISCSFLKIQKRSDIDQTI